MNFHKVNVRVFSAPPISPVLSRVYSLLTPAQVHTNLPPFTLSQGHFTVMGFVWSLVPASSTQLPVWEGCVIYACIWQCVSPFLLQNITPPNGYITSPLSMPLSGYTTPLLSTPLNGYTMSPLSTPWNGYTTSPSSTHRRVGMGVVLGSLWMSLLSTLVHQSLYFFPSRETQVKLLGHMLHLYFIFLQSTKLLFYMV